MLAGFPQVETSLLAEQAGLLEARPAIRCPVAVGALRGERRLRRVETHFPRRP
jgi:hypothetical protein